MTPALQFCHTSLDYAAHRVLQGVDLAIAQGGITAVMGCNGSGKTTLLRLACGLLKPSSGQVLLLGHDIASYNASALARQVAIVRQHPQADFSFSAFETVLMGRNPYQHRLQAESQADLDIVQESMQFTDTWHLRDKRLNQLSGGEMQRIMIARALTQRTPLLLMDEPVSNLDIAHQLHIMQLLRRSTDKTILIVLHDLDLALHFCDSLILLHQGTVHYHGPAAAGLTPDNIQTIFNVHAHIADGHILTDYWHQP